MNDPNFDGIGLRNAKCMVTAMLFVCVFSFSTHAQETNRKWSIADEIRKNEVFLNRLTNDRFGQQTSDATVLWPPNPASNADRWWEPGISYHDEIVIDVSEGGKHVRDFRFHEDCANIAFSDKGLIYCGLEDGTVRVMDIHSGDERDKFRLGTESIQYITVSKNGDRLIAGAPSVNKVYVWDLRRRKSLAEHRLPKPWSVNQMKFSPDGRYVAVDGYSGTERVLVVGPYGEWIEEQPITDENVYAYDTIKGRLMFQRRGFLHQGQTAITNDGRLVLSNGQIWNIRSGSESFDPMVELETWEHPLIFDNHSFSSDGKQVFLPSIESVDATIRPGDRPNYRKTVETLVVKVLSSSNGSVSRVIRPGIRPVATYQGGVDLLGGNRFERFCESPDGSLIAFAGRQFVESSTEIGDYETVVNVVSVKSGKVTQLPWNGDDAEYNGVEEIRFSNDGKHLAAITWIRDRKSVLIWDVTAKSSRNATPQENITESGVEQRRIPAHEAIELAFVRFTVEERELKQQRRMRQMTNDKFEAASKSLCNRLIDDFGHIYRGRSNDEANEISRDYEAVYMSENQIIPERIGEVVGDDRWKVIGTLMSITNGDPNLGF